MIRVPKPLAAGVVNEHSWLILQWIHEGPKPSDFFERFGHALAELHRCTMGSEIGWKEKQLHRCVGTTQSSDYELD